MKSYRFFFSYSSETHRASEGRLDQFFKALCNRVALQAGSNIEEVGYRDCNRLTLASFWGRELVTALQQSRVLIAVISPHYLKSLPCGREVEFFSQRFGLLGPLPHEQPHRIVPVFWVEKNLCVQHMRPTVERFLHDLHQRQAGMPQEYPHTGLETFYFLGEQQCCNQMLHVLATAINRLSDLPPLPLLAGNHDFSALPSFFLRGDAAPKPQVGSGPTSTNVIYAVATRNEAANRSLVNPDAYAVERDQWRPFADAPGATIDMATKEGLNASGQSELEYYNLGLPDDVADRLRMAKSANSPLLFVMDRSSLHVPEVSAPLQIYDQLDYPNVGLVTAGGSEADEKLPDYILPTKFRTRRQHHLWTVPSTRHRYVQDVSDVVGGLRRSLQQTGPTAITLAASTLPGL
jgi:hypothetical protein